MKLEKQQGRTCYLLDTTVENIFINEYMPEAPDGFVKVYLVALMYAGMDGDISAEEIARTLAVSPQDVEKALEYWSKAGVVKKTGAGVQFVSLKEQLYGSHDAGESTIPDPARKLMNDERVARMFDRIEQYTKEYLQPQQMQTILGWITDYDASFDVVEAAYKYCAEIGKTNTRYVEAVVKNWTGKGIRTSEEIEELLENMDRRHSVHKRVMRALGFTRNATEAERDMINGWIDDLSCSMEEILDACAKTTGISNPNLNYVDSVLRRGSEKKTKGPSGNKVMEYYAKMRERSSADAAKRRRKVYEYVPRIEKIDLELKDLNLELTKSLMSGRDTSKLRSSIEALTNERDRLMTEHDIPIDYTNIRPSCRICADTGITKEGARCRCYEEVARLAAAEGL